jgi:DNA polymerase I-like protein with 3'-5' exonuclease and polymerase domains
MAVEFPVLPNGSVISLDTETSGRHPDDGCAVSTVSVAWVDPATTDLVRTLAIPFNQGVTKWKPEWRGVVSLFAEDQAVNQDLATWIQLWDWLADKQIVMMNGPFDCRFMARGVDRPEARWSANYDLMSQVIWDVGVASREIWPRRSIALKPTSVAVELLHPRHWVDIPLPVRENGGWYKTMESADKEDIKAYLRLHKYPVTRYDLIEWFAMEPYAALDAELTLRLYLFQKALIQGNDHLTMWIDREHRKMRALHPTEMRGIPADIPGYIEEAEKIRKARIDIAKTLPFGNPFGGEININEAKRFFFEGGCPEAEQFLEFTEKGGIKLTKEIARRLVKNNVPSAKQWMQYKELGDALSKWYVAFPEKAGSDGRLRPVFNISTVKSGRTSTSRINMQGVPGDYRVIERLPQGVRTPRQLMRAEPGHALWSLDVAQAELRIAARWAPCPTMLDLIRAGEDLHSYSAIQLFGIDKEHPDWSLMRHVAKTGNFALIYDCGAKTFQEMLSVQVGIEWPLKKVERLVYDWKDLYPEFRAAVLRASRVVEQRSFIKLKNGRQSWFDQQDMMNPHKAFNRFVQGSLAEMAADWLVWTEENHPGLMVNFVHDAIYLHVPYEREGEVEPIKQKGIEIFETMFDVVGGIDAHIDSRGA